LIAHAGGLLPTAVFWIAGARAIGPVHGGIGASLRIVSAGFAASPALVTGSCTIGTRAIAHVLPAVAVGVRAVLAGTLSIVATLPPPLIAAPVPLRLASTIAIATLPPRVLRGAAVGPGSLAVGEDPLHRGAVVGAIGGDTACIGAVASGPLRGPSTGAGRPPVAAVGAERVLAVRTRLPVALVVRRTASPRAPLPIRRTGLPTRLRRCLTVGTRAGLPLLASTRSPRASLFAPASVARPRSLLPLSGLLSFSATAIAGRFVAVLATITLLLLRTLLIVVFPVPVAIAAGALARLLAGVALVGLLLILGPAVVLPLTTILPLAAPLRPLAPAALVGVARALFPGSLAVGIIGDAGLIGGALLGLGSRVDLQFLPR
jgi:hypothetical protein